MSKEQIVKKDDIVVRFAGDSGDGMQLSGTLFSDASALTGNDIATFPDYPAEIRAPHNTIAGVSGYQVHVGKHIYSSGDKCDILVAMNPASFKSQLKWAKKGATVIVDADTFTPEALEKAGYKENPFTEEFERAYTIVHAPVTSFTQRIGQEQGVDKKTADKSRNMFALGMIFFLTNKTLEKTFAYLERKFAKKPEVVKLNKAVLSEGYEYAEKLELIHSKIVEVAKASEMPKGRYRNITGNVATAWGLLAAAERSGRRLFLGSYPITPATDVMVELAKHKGLGARVFQAEDEIAGICSAIGASYAGALACTSTSGPGLSLKSEALGLAVMTELPLVVVDVQRGGPSTGLPTKTEQSDLNQALYGRNGEAPLIVVAASSSANCFYWAYTAAKLALEHMTPVILLTDGYLGNGSQLFRIPKVADLPSITPRLAKPNDPNYRPFRRDPETFVREWALPGMEGLRHRVGGLEKAPEGNLSTDPENHALMVHNRQEKVDRVANNIPDQEVTGNPDADLLVVGWGGTSGALTLAVEEMNNEGKKVAYTHFNYICPLPKNTGDILRKYKKIVVCELNNGQFLGYLRTKYPDCPMTAYNKIMGLPFEVSELKDHFNSLLEK
ncbi:MAG: 2-oxoacid:acceptor oxidoreductase subunit alpha [Bacteroidales bacterium]|nr:2-oxoacid:acceptor oxidoreductase subunit alpha [Bacteroidales bacterium]MBR3413722.1 2-oxoacid:acceptor oxidoreductase subunit alpha [Bacteroidales bacterium]